MTKECRWKWKTGGGRMLPLLGERKKGVLRELFLSRKKEMRKCSSDGLDIFSKRGGNVMG